MLYVIVGCIVSQSRALAYDDMASLSLEGKWRYSCSEAIRPVPLCRANQFAYLARFGRPPLPQDTKIGCAQKLILPEVSMHKAARGRNPEFFSFAFTEIVHYYAHPASMRGAFRPIVAIREAGMRWT
jgi:hypothetical protein